MSHNYKEGKEFRKRFPSVYRPGKGPSEKKISPPSKAVPMVGGSTPIGGTAPSTFGGGSTQIGVTPPRKSQSKYLKPKTGGSTGFGGGTKGFG